MSTYYDRRKMLDTVGQASEDAVTRLDTWLRPYAGGRDCEEEPTRPLPGVKQLAPLWAVELAVELANTCFEINRRVARNECDDEAKEMLRTLIAECERAERVHEERFDWTNERGAE